MVSVTLLEGFDPTYIFKSKLDFKNWLLSTIDLTYLPPYLPDEQLKQFVDKAKKYGFKHIFIPITAIQKAKYFLGDSDIKIITFVSSFHGNRDSLEEKKLACSDAIRLGSDEIEFSPNLSLLQDKSVFKKECQEIIDLTRENQRISKLYLEIDKLPEEMISDAITAAIETHPDYIDILIKLKEEESYDGENLNISKVWFEKVDSIVRKRSGINLKVYGRIESLNTFLPILYLVNKYGWNIESFRIGTEFGFDIIDGIDVS